MKPRIFRSQESEPSSIPRPEPRNNPSSKQFKAKDVSIFFETVQRRERISAGPLRDTGAVESVYQPTMACGDIADTSVADKGIKDMTSESIYAGFARKLLPMLPPSTRNWLLEYRRKRSLRPRIGAVRFGSFRRVTPISISWGFERGQPVDRYYIESFLERHAEDVQGRVLELEDNTYTKQFGGGRVRHSDVLNVKEGNPNSTIVADLTERSNLPSEAFDCIIFTQALQFMYDSREALTTLHRALKPSGVILATVPAITQIDRFDPGVEQYWSFTPKSVERLFGECFPDSAIAVEHHGNVLAAISFLEGIASQELRRDELDCRDPYYPVTITVRAQKRK